MAWDDTQTADSDISYVEWNDMVTYINAIPNAGLVTAKGDLMIGTALDTLGILNVGTNDFVLTADSAEATGVKWAAGGGSASISDTVYGVSWNGVTTIGASKNAIYDKIEIVDTAVILNTAKVTNVSTTLSTGTVTATTYGITSDGGADDVVLPEADTNDAGLLGADKWDEIVASTTHLSSNGSDHSFIDQDVTTSGTPTFGSVNTGTGQNTFQSIKLNSDAAGLKVYAQNGSTLLFEIDSSGNVGMLGTVYQI